MQSEKILYYPLYILNVIFYIVNELRMKKKRSHKMQFGRTFEEFEIGAIYKHWPGRTITEYDDTLFSMLTMNHNPLHIDANYCEDTEFKQRLVVGPLIFSIALGMSVPDVSGKAIANLEFENVRHLRHGSNGLDSVTHQAAGT
jgi:acyl dehydratase